MLKNPQRFWLIALILGWLVDFLFWDKTVGISFFLWIALALVGGFLLARFEGVHAPHRTLFLSALIIISAGLTLVRAAPFPRLINVFVALLGLVLLVRTFRSGGWTHFNLLQLALTYLDGLWFGFTRALRLRLAPADNAGGARAVVRRILPVVRGLLLALPVVLLFGALLSSADLVFAGEIDRLVQMFALDRWPEYIARLFLVLICTYILAGLYAQAVRPQRWLTESPGDEAVEPQALPLEAVPAEQTDDLPAAVPAPAAAQLPEHKSQVSRFLGPTETFMILGSVDALFLAFVAIQFRYFFGGQMNINTAGFTYAEYARRGFMELVYVAVFSLLLYLLLDTIYRRSTRTVERTFTILSTVLVGSVLVILVSAFQRLLLYEGAYGFTRQRTYTHIFMPWLAVLLIGTILLRILRREQVWGALIVLVAFGFVATSGILNVDGLIARQNIARALAGEELDGKYLLVLSDDALPALAQGYQNPSAPATVHDVLGAALACKFFRAERDEPLPWQSYHPGSARAWQSVAGLDLVSYTVSDDGYVNAVSYEGSPYHCFDESGLD